MALPKFIYLMPKNLKEASIMLAEHEDKARVIAGGTDLLIRMQHRVVQPQFLISLNRIPDIGYITLSHDKELTIGAGARLSAVGAHPAVQRYFSSLAYAASVTATVQIRNMGTVVGNICNASPSADTATPLLVYDAKVVILHPGGERILPLSAFFRGPGITALESGEIVKEIVLPGPEEKSASNYQKLSGRSKVDIAAVGASVYLSLAEDEKVKVARIAIGAVAPVPKRVHHVEQFLEGTLLTSDIISKAAALSKDNATPITDMRATEAYRKKMVEVLTARALTQCLQRIREQGPCT